MRREWIEMHQVMPRKERILSPSMRREWIEISDRPITKIIGIKSPSMRREWIEMS